MASSQSLSESVRKRGQTAMQCQLCKNNPKLKWKCLDCKLMMCERCRDKVHPKFPSAEDHIFIDIKDISKHPTEFDPKPDLTKLKCDVHNGQNCCRYCEACEVLVCQTCVTKSHKKHKFTEIRAEYEIKLAKLKDEQKNIGKTIHILTLNEQKLKQTKSSEQSNYEKVKQEIFDDDKALIDEIKKYTNKLLKELDQKWEAVSNYFDSETKRTKKDRKDIQDQQRKINQLLQVDNVKDVFSGSYSMFKSRQENIQPLQMAIKGHPKYSNGDKSKFSQILGKLDEVAIQIDSDLKLQAQFKTELTAINSAISCSDGGLWICDKNSGTVQKVKLNKDILKVIAHISMEVYDAALLHSGDLLLSVFESSNLKLIPFGSKDIKNSMYTVSELQPTGIHITKDNKIIIGARETGPPFPVNGPRKVIVMDQSGHKEKVIENDRHNKPLFSLPLFITSNSQCSIAVVDLVSIYYRGRVVVLDKEGEVRNIYSGHPDVNNKNLFIPQGITSTPSDNFVVTDMYNHTLHILNSEGEFITFYNTKEMGILLPYSLSFSTTGHLYIGCDTYTDSVDKAKLFVIDNFLF